MAAFVMVLAMGMAVGSGPEAASAAMEQGLDLRGRWEGTLTTHGKGQDVYLSDGVLGRAGPEPWKAPFHIAKEGEGKVKVSIVDVHLSGHVFSSPGIYRWEGNSLVLCWHNDGDRPLSFLSCGGQEILILHRVKPDK